MSDFNETREAYIERVTKEGYVIVLPKENELQIDIDPYAQHANFTASLAILMREYPDCKVEEHPSKSGIPCRHITITLPFDVQPWERIAWQAALGSDPVRELLSCHRMRNGDTAPTLFCEKP